MGLGYYGKYGKRNDHTIVLLIELCLNTVDVGGLVDVIRQGGGYLALLQCVDI
jgi:hypothetical protein